MGERIKAADNNQSVGLDNARGLANGQQKYRCFQSRDDGNSYASLGRLNSGSTASTRGNMNITSSTFLANEILMHME